METVQLSVMAMVPVHDDREQPSSIITDKVERQLRNKLTDSRGRCGPETVQIRPWRLDVLRGPDDVLRLYWVKDAYGKVPVTDGVAVEDRDFQEWLERNPPKIGSRPPHAVEVQ